jgi:hypothetical protein
MTDPARLPLAKVYGWKPPSRFKPHPLDSAEEECLAPPAPAAAVQGTPVSLQAAAKALRVSEAMLLDWLQDGAPGLDVSAIEAWRAAWARPYEAPANGRVNASAR